MTRKEYNGWTNYETWAVKLWIDSEEGSSNYWLEQAEECATGEHPEWALEERLKGEHEEALPEIHGFAADLLNAAMSEVNWREIANSLLEQAKTEA